VLYSVSEVRNFVTGLDHPEGIAVGRDGTVYAGGELGPVHFGLGSQDQARVRVTWPDGSEGPWQTVPADRTITIDRQPGETGALESSGS